MLFCSDEKCGACEQIEGSADCLRKQAQNCAMLAKKAFRSGTRYALEELSLSLMDEARAVDNEQTVPAAPINLN